MASKDNFFVTYFGFCLICKYFVMARRDCLNISYVYLLSQRDARCLIWSRSNSIFSVPNGNLELGLTRFTLSIPSRVANTKQWFSSPKITVLSEETNSERVLWYDSSLEVLGLNWIDLENKWNQLIRQLIASF